MALEGNIEYALTRVQSQYGSRPDRNQWQRLQAAHDLGQYLEGARSSLFAPWLASLDPHRDAHAIERTLRGAWRRHVRTVAGWHPRRWQPWLTWLEWLPTLGLLARLELPGPLPAWLLADPVVEPLARRAAPLEQRWPARWRALRPPTDALTEHWLAAVDLTVRAHAKALVLPGTDAAALREQLRGRLDRLFRAAAGTVVATFCYLALLALDFERLRGDLVTRCLFGRDR